MFSSTVKFLLPRIKRNPSVQFRLCSTHFEAACLEEYGEKLKIKKVKRSPLKPNEVRLQVKYCSLNYNDVKYLERRDDGEKTLPYIPGYELSGEVIETGGDCEVREGDRVVGLSRGGSGGVSTEAVLEERDVWKLPPEVSSKEATALISAHSTALLAFTHHHQLQEGSTVLVIAGAGGYGLAAVDIASNIFKAKVIAVSDADSKASVLRDRGAFSTIHNNHKSNAKEVGKATGGKGVDLIYDAVGGNTINTLVQCLKDPEKGVILGTYRLRRGKGKKEGEKDHDDDDKDKEEEPTEQVAKLFQTVNLFMFQRDNQEQYREVVQQVLEYCEEEVLAPAHISKVYPLGEINEAIHFIKGKTCTGKVLIHMNRD